MDTTNDRDISGTGRLLMCAVANPVRLGYHPGLDMRPTKRHRRGPAECMNGDELHQAI
jgi:hypothetical protein